MSKPELNWQRVVDFINEYDFFLVLGHVSPDGDCIGSQLALSSVLKRMGKQAIPCSRGPFSKPEIKLNQADLAYDVPFDVLDGQLVGILIVDCASLSRTGYPHLPYPAMAIDHHANVESDAVPRVVDSTSPACSLLILQLMQTLGFAPTKDEAHWLLLGFCSDTGFFRHLKKNAGDALRDSALLVDAGASPAVIFSLMEGRYRLQDRQYLGNLLQSAQVVSDGKILLVTEDADRLEWLTQKPSRDVDTLYRLLLSVEGVDTVIVLREDDNGNTVAGLRSMGEINVGLLAQNFGGGGHDKAAGFVTPKKLADIKPLILVAAQQQLLKA